MTVIYVEELSVVFSVMALLLNLHGAILWGNTLSNTRKLNRAVSISNPSIIQLKDFLITEGNKPFINSWFYLNAFMLLGYSLSSVVLGYTTLTILLLVMAIFFFSITWILIASTIRHGTYDTFQIEHDDRN
ncbi:MAG: hypothetical protein UZ21_OP11001000873 [Microgenomates bacterium OLB22]|nr:MAG: hypothetical protein UZ21_OP11001000873 [Microgenomates bacterium OLB22]